MHTNIHVYNFYLDIENLFWLCSVLLSIVIIPCYMSLHEIWIRLILLAYMYINCQFIYRYWFLVFKYTLQGVYVLQDNKFRFLTQISNGKQFMETAPKVCTLNTCMGCLSYSYVKYYTIINDYSEWSSVQSKVNANA